jgi:Response regulator containing CheY-like receiver, AAA-type ATPase, and DNA-binding domains
MENLNRFSHKGIADAKGHLLSFGAATIEHIGGLGKRMFRILLAEDDDSMRQYLVRALERSGYEVVAVDRGTAALPIIASERFDLLLTDIVMPEMDGIELAQHVASVSPETRVMFITGFAAVTLRAGRLAPEAKVLSKPFHLRDLVLEVDRMFNRTSAENLL